MNIKAPTGRFSLQAHAPAVSTSANVQVPAASFGLSGHSPEISVVSAVTAAAVAAATMSETKAILTAGRRLATLDPSLVAVLARSAKDFPISEHPELQIANQTLLAALAYQEMEHRKERSAHARWTIGLIAAFVFGLIGWAMALY